MSEFTGWGWRRQEQPGCFAPCPKPRHIQEYIGDARVEFPWRCERPKGHKGWHCCDNASWKE